MWLKLCVKDIKRLFTSISIHKYGGNGFKPNMGVCVCSTNAKYSIVEPTTQCKQIKLLHLFYRYTHTNKMRVRRWWLQQFLYNSTRLTTTLWINAHTTHSWMAKFSSQIFDWTMCLGCDATFSIHITHVYAIDNNDDFMLLNLAWKKNSPRASHANIICTYSNTPTRTRAPSHTTHRYLSG